MAEIVETYGNGLVYQRGDGQDLLFKIKEIEDKYARFKIACKLARRTWEKENSWSSFYEDLIN